MVILYSKIQFRLQMHKFFTQNLAFDGQMFKFRAETEKSCLSVYALQ